MLCCPFFNSFCYHPDPLFSSSLSSLWPEKLTWVGLRRCPFLLHLFKRRCLTKMKKRWNARLETGRWVFGSTRKPRLFWFHFWLRDLRHLFVSGSWYCQIQTTWLIMFFNYKTTIFYCKLVIYQKKLSLRPFWYASKDYFEENKPISLSSSPPPAHKESLKWLHSIKTYFAGGSGLSLPVIVNRPRFCFFFSSFSWEAAKEKLPCMGAISFIWSDTIVRI